MPLKEKFVEQPEAVKSVELNVEQSDGTIKLGDSRTYMIRLAIENGTRQLHTIFGFEHGLGVLFDIFIITY